MLKFKEYLDLSSQFQSYLYFKGFECDLFYETALCLLLKVTLFKILRVQSLTRKRRKDLPHEKIDYN